MGDRRLLKPDGRTHIGHPFNFQHTTHVYKETENACYKGVPASWRGSFAQHSFSKDGNASRICTEDFINILKVRPLTTYHSKRRRIDLLYNKNMANYKELTGFLGDRVIYECPVILEYNLSVLYDYGSWGIIYGYKKSTEELYCFKFYRINQKTNTMDIKEEVQFHISYSHPNIVDLVEAHICPFSVVLTFKTFNEIPLSDLIAFAFSPSMSKDDKRYDIDIVAYIMYSITSGLNYIHRNGYIHCDIKSENIIILEDGSIKISDFGICRKITKNLIAQEIFGTPCWMAPEIAKGERYGEKVDIWSLGCVLVELIQGQPPFYFLEPYHAIEKLKSKNIAPFVVSNTNRLFSPLLMPFIEACLAIEAIQRASAMHLLFHPFILKKSSAEEMKLLLSVLSNVS